jgi:tRNA A-37 threonylcarbamoyl transferase component Bud32
MNLFARLWRGRPGEAAPQAPDAPPLFASKTPTAADGAVLNLLPSVVSSRPGVGDVLGKCRLMRLLGEGAYGQVYYGHHQSLNVAVAVKLLQPALFNDPAVHLQLRNEAQVLARLNHPHVVRVWDFEDDPTCPYLILEYVEGLNLAELIEQSGRVAPGRAVRMLREIARGLAAAWKLGIIHRDLKPANILLTRDGQAKLADLGLAVVIGTPGLAGNDGPQAAPVGTAAYVAPEQCFAPETVDQRSDIYSLGATFYHAVTGKMPFTGPSVRAVMLMHATEEVVPPHDIVPSIGESLATVLLKMMAKKQSERFQDYTELLQALDHVVAKTTEADAASKEILRTEAPRGRGCQATTTTWAMTAKGTEHDFRLPPDAGLPEGVIPMAAPAVSTEDELAEKLWAGVAAARNGEAELATKLLKEVTAHQPGNEIAWLWLAHVAPSPQEAAACYQHVLKVNPDNSLAEQGLQGARLAAAVAQAQSGNPAAAVRGLRFLLEQNPEHTQARAWLNRIEKSG